MTLMNSLLTFAQQGAAPAAQPGATPAPGATPPATPAAPAVSAADREAARQAGEAAQQEAAGHSEVSLMELVRELNAVELGVMIILGLCAVYAVALLFEKIYVMRKAAKQTKDFLAAFRKANSVEEAEAIVRKLPNSGIKSMFDAGMAEVRRTQDLGLYTMRDARDHTMQRVSSAMSTRQNEHLDDLGSSMTFLASIGANAPFIGLFGTVWGIMVAFVGIAKTQTTSLAVVAPGIAGALLATAAGLAAAIPAVLIYNFAAKQISKQGQKLDDFAAEFIALVSRDMDRRAG
ncbi:MAG TPA: MotA/TolQ/ExbB proton channel family protein [Vitreimonas sp.]|uniref:MotA/TolQ/ExbB proton channel family protein n=1 Tax=Vitreimonas sp. TaxID=3069702 RepID=UPI002D2787F2|nr:MotA/TolQ/ExbB proton channel family protein [Vitreimonas sp.]HYD89146.1 MotA/TolQ/ExbB proton channel family protein [Vitreimonas sp.]